MNGLSPESLDVTVLHHTTNRGIAVQRGNVRVLATRPTEPGMAHLRLVVDLSRGAFEFSVVLSQEDARLLRQMTGEAVFASIVRRRKRGDDA